MKSIKPGRGPSGMGAIGSIAVGIIGIFWTIAAAGMGAPPFFIMFGFIFVILAIVQGVYHYKNATGKNRMSLYDITDDKSEPDPFNKLVNKNISNHEGKTENTDSVSFCPYCGNKVTDRQHKFCSKCGKELN